MNALRTAVGTAPQRRRYLAMGAVLGVGAYALGATLAEPFTVTVSTAVAAVGAVSLVLLAAVAAYDGAGFPATAGLVALVTAGLVPFGVTVVSAGPIPTDAARVAYTVTAALAAGVALGLIGFLIGAGGRLVRETDGSGAGDGADAEGGPDD